MNGACQSKCSFIEDSVLPLFQESLQIWQPTDHSDFSCCICLQTATLPVDTNWRHLFCVSSLERERSAYRGHSTKLSSYRNLKSCVILPGINVIALTRSKVPIFISPQNSVFLFAHRFRIYKVPLLKCPRSLKATRSNRSSHRILLNYNTNSQNG